MNKFKTQVQLLKLCYLLLLFVVFQPRVLPAQPGNSELLQLNTERLRITRQSMTVLGGWAALNMGSGLILQANAEGEDRYFHRMNATWNVVNAGLASLGYFNARRSQPASWDLVQSRRGMRKLRQTLLLNAGIDTGYMMAGIWLHERGKNPTLTTDQGDRFRGWGKSLILQGGFLFAFDLLTFYRLRKPQRRLDFAFQ